MENSVGVRACPCVCVVRCRVQSSRILWTLHHNTAIEWIACDISFHVCWYV